MSKLTRRDFLQGCSVAIAALAGARLTRLAYAAPDDPADTLVVVFLRGGWDALNVIPPLEGDDRGFYEKARPGIKIPRQKLINLNDQFGLHPALAPLHELYQAGKLGIVQAVGLDYDTRSHFDAMEFIELGTPGSKTQTSGWLTRHLHSAPAGPGGLLPALATPIQPTALLGLTATVSLSSPGDFSLWDNGLQGEQIAALRTLYQGETRLQRSGLETLQALETLAPLNAQTYRPQNGARYRDDEFGRQLRLVAQLIKMGTGLRVATVDYGGWDTHQAQNEAEGGTLGGLLRSLGENLASFYADLDAGYTERLSVVVLSEFGRRLAQNESGGTDHGHGSVMLALGGGVHGGQLHGRWPGLANAQLYDRADLAITTDYRQVLGDLLVNRLKNPQIEAVFPGYGAEFQPFGLFKA